MMKISNTVFYWKHNPKNQDYYGTQFHHPHFNRKRRRRDRMVFDICE